MQKGFTVTINGAPRRLNAMPGTYVSINRQWKSGDTIEIAMPFSLRTERALDQPQTEALAYGPIPMVTLSSSKNYLEYSFFSSLDMSGDLIKATTPTGTPMTFTTNGQTIRPFYINDTSAYHMYFHRKEPDVVFGSKNTGVPNVAGTDGLTLLDVVWAKAPFSNHGQFVSTVDNTCSDFVRQGLLTSAQAQTIITAAAHFKP